MRALSLLLAALCAATPVAAQSLRPVFRVRLYEPLSSRYGATVRTTLDSLRPDSISIPDRQGGTVLVPMRHVEGVDSLVRLTPTGARIRRGATSGVLVGGLAGAGLGYLAYQSSSHGSFDSRGANALAGLGLGAASGALIGVLVGALRSPEEWRQVWPRF